MPQHFTLFHPKNEIAYIHSFSLCVCVFFSSLPSLAPNIIHLYHSIYARCFSIHFMVYVKFSSRSLHTEIAIFIRRYIHSMLSSCYFFCSSFIFHNNIFFNGLFGLLCSYSLCLLHTDTLLVIVYTANTHTRAPSANGQENEDTLLYFHFGQFSQANYLLNKQQVSHIYAHSTCIISGRLFFLTPPFFCKSNLRFILLVLMWCRIKLLFAAH